ncbi:hypothetical protein TH25_08600 [Thalassospira profundimaris]|uniref:Uncharacterized protein n=1 Tax=Thalassospira profundimaris TaxID=502049 RepID=A0A367XGB7_9PROT|nr:hypothetical protein [Thalassospira profundimaris]RCK51722.1 hypothetical protein TH25_08600 [Thalassospira profundimaris]
MFLELFKDTPGYPFEEYFRSTEQFFAAQQYWLHLLRQLKSFVESDWGGVIRPVNLKEDMLTGKVIWIRNQSDKKEIVLQTLSFEGSINELLDSNDAMEPEFIEKFENIGTELDDRQKREMTYDEAMEIEKSEYSGFSAWVETSDYFHADPSTSGGGYDVPIERLILTSEISETAEQKAIQALDLFLQPGPAMVRVNSVFSPDD